jgi:hypothetical protein
MNRTLAISLFFLVMAPSYVNAEALDDSQSVSVEVAAPVEVSPLQQRWVQDPRFEASMQILTNSAASVAATFYLTSVSLENLADFQPGAAILCATNGVSLLVECLIKSTSITPKSPIDNTLQVLDQTAQAIVAGGFGLISSQSKMIPNSLKVGSVLVTSAFWARTFLLEVSIARHGASELFKRNRIAKNINKRLLYGIVANVAATVLTYSTVVGDDGDRFWTSAGILGGSILLGCVIDSLLILDDLRSQGLLRCQVRSAN